MEEMTGAYGFFVRKTEGMRPFGKSRSKWDDSIKINLQDVGWGHELNCSDSE